MTRDGSTSHTHIGSCYYMPRLLVRYTALTTEVCRDSYCCIRHKLLTRMLTGSIT
ncbi:MAG: hypothetical protein IKY64_09545 [Bacteroidaceae bacterium]|nr:hypothetical protein [Bacteroidaceae bacterium]